VAFAPALIPAGIVGGTLIVAVLGAGVAIAALGGLIFLAAIKLTQLFYQVTLKYLKLNVKIIRQN